MAKVDYRKIAEQIFLAGVESVLPGKIIPGLVSISGSLLKIGDLEFELNEINNIYVIGAGKASGSMAAELEKILGKRISAGHIIVKYGYSCKLDYIKITEAGHPAPDFNGFRASQEILKLAIDADKNDLVICLLSGGGSSLLADIAEGCTAEDMALMNDLLVNCGAGIREINAVRKHLSKIKGGQLVKFVYPATLGSLILSDVPGDNLSDIASGPTVPDSTTFEQAMEILYEYELEERVPRSVIKYLEEGINGNRQETPDEDNIIFQNTFSILAGSIKMALRSSAFKAMDLNIETLVVDEEFEGDISFISEYLIQMSLLFKNDPHQKKPFCLLFGGESTIRMRGKGMGGRNQHLALQLAIMLKDTPGITILSAGTDGNDGPTDAAGAVVDSETVKTALSKNINPLKYLEEFDSYNFFKNTGGHIITGPTMTNVMDMIVVIIS